MSHGEEGGHQPEIRSLFKYPEPSQSRLGNQGPVLTILRISPPHFNCCFDEKVKTCYKSTFHLIVLSEEHLQSLPYIRGGRQLNYQAIFNSQLPLNR